MRRVHRQAPNARGASCAARLRVRHVDHDVEYDAAEQVDEASSPQFRSVSHAEALLPINKPTSAGLRSLEPALPTIWVEHHAGPAPLGQE